ncbi:MAG: hypothetical protein ACJA13_000533 [Paraglaciecola sp.]|jgi:hypothetical protein
MLSLMLLGLLCTFWLASATHKFLYRARFTMTLNEYKWIPNINHRVLVTGLILVELGIALLLLFPVSQLFALALACAALLAYTGLIWLNIIAGNRALDCGCLFSSEEQGLGYVLLWRNGGILLLHVFAVITLEPDSHPIDVFTGLLFGGVVLLLGIISQQLIRNQSHIKAIKR